MKFILKFKFFNKEILKDLYEYSMVLSDEDYSNIRQSVEVDFIKPKRRVKK